MGYKWRGIAILALLLICGSAGAQQINQLPGNATVPIPSGSCFPLDQFTAGVFTTTKLCSNYAAAFGAAPSLPAGPCALLGLSGSAFGCISLGTGLSLSSNVLSATGGGGSIPSAPLINGNGLALGSVVLGTNLSIAGVFPNQTLNVSNCPVGMKCVVPTGVAATDTAAIQAAVNTDFSVVLLEPGTFKLNASIGISHRNVVVMGWSGTYPAGLGGSVPPYPSIINVDCSGIARSGNNGCFNVTNQSAHFSGFRIYANAGSGLNCITDGDSGLVIDGDMELDNCYDGVYIDAATGSTTGFALNIFISNTYIPYSWQYAIWCNCSDFMFGPNIATEVAGGTFPGGGTNGAVGLAAGAIHGRIANNFFADGFNSPCLFDNGASFIAFNNNECANSGGVYMYNSGVNSTQINDNTFFKSTNSNYGIDIQGTGNQNFQINGNTFYYGYVACFRAGPGAISGMLQVTNNNCQTIPSANGALYADLTTEIQLDPWVWPRSSAQQGASPNSWVTLTNTAGSISAPDWQTSFNIKIPLVHGVTNSLPNPVYTQTGQTGLFFVTQSATGGDTVGTYGNLYLGTFASPSAGASITDVYPWITTTFSGGQHILIGAKIGSIPAGD